MTPPDGLGHLGAACLSRTDSLVDRELLERTLVLAELGRPGARPNPVVGAVLALPDGTVLAEGHHVRRGLAHAERACLEAFGDGPVPADATLYVSLEPCDHQGRQPPCSQLLVDRGIRRVVFASCDPNPITAGRGPSRLHGAGIEVLRGPLDIERRALQQNAGFHSAHLRGRPYVTAKWAMTRDGGFATGDPDRRWISGGASRDEVHAMRAGSGAVACGIGTVLADDPLLTVRGPVAAHTATQPVRLVFDRTLRLPLDSQLVRGAQTDAPVLVVTAHDAAPERELALLDAGVRVWRTQPPEPGAPCLPAASLTMLTELEIQDVLLEAGPRLLVAFAEAGLVDAAVAYVAPIDSTGDVPRVDLDHPFVREVVQAPSRASGEDVRHELLVHPVWGIPGALCGD